MDKKAMFSQSMSGKTDKEIIETRERAIHFLESKDFKVVNDPFTDERYSSDTVTEEKSFKYPLWFLAKSLEGMSFCHAVYFCEGWEKDSRCKIEHDIAVAYGLEVLYENSK